ARGHPRQDGGKAAAPDRPEGAGDRQWPGRRGRCRRCHGRSGQACAGAGRGASSDHEPAADQARADLGKAPAGAFGEGQQALTESSPELEVVRGLARALDVDDFEAAAGFLSPACEYDARGERLVGREAIIASYAASSAWGRGNLSSLTYASEVEPPRDGEVPV